MRITKITLQNFKRFTDLTISDIPQTARLVLLVGPSGSGKSSLFEGINYWSKRQFVGLSDSAYYYKNEKAGDITPRNIFGEVHVETVPPNADPRSSVYVRSAYRHTSEFDTRTIQKINEDQHWLTTTTKMTSGDQEVAANYQRLYTQIMSDIFHCEKGELKGREIAARVVGRVKKATQQVFDNLTLLSLQDPDASGTFYFSKGAARNYDFKNLSGGERAVFDLLLDFIVKKERFSDAVICIDEPEVHLGLKAQGALLRAMHSELPEKCQLWLATHSIGVLRAASEIAKENPGEVVFLEFDQDFDKPATIEPVVDPDRKFWEKLHHHTLEDLAAFIMPETIVVCESRENVRFDAKCYNTIFAQSRPDVLFVSAGSHTQLPSAAVLLRQLTKGDIPKIITVRDRDQMTPLEMNEKTTPTERILNRQSIESYLIDNEVLCKFAQKHRIPDNIMAQIREKAGGVGKDKAKASQIYKIIKDSGALDNYGSDRDALLVEYFAPLIEKGMSVFQELENAIFGENGDSANAQ